MRKQLSRKEGRLLAMRTTVCVFLVFGDSARNGSQLLLKVDTRGEEMKTLGQLVSQLTLGPARGPGALCPT